MNKMENKKEALLSALLEERGWWWPDGTLAYPDQVPHAIAEPWHYDLDWDPDTWAKFKAAAEGDAAALVVIRKWFGLPVFP